MPSWTATVSLIALAIMTASAQAAEIKAIVTGALTAPFREIVPAYQRESGNTVAIAWGPSSGNSPDAIPVRLRNREPADVLIMIRSAMDDMINQGLFKPAERVNVAQSGIGVGVPSGAPKPDVSSADALKRALLAAKSIGYSEGGSGVYVGNELLKRLGIAEQVAPELKLVAGELVGEAIARGEVEIGIQQISELRAVRGVDYVGPLPGDLQKANIISAAVSLDAKQPEAARSFAAFLSSPPAAKAITNSGLDLPPSK
jgi:molybdate transport system substrate-binding protein